MKTFVLTVLLLLGNLLAWAGTPLTPQQKQEVIKNINKAAAEVKTLRCSFVQTKHLSLLSNELKAEGNFCYQQPDKLRWEYVSPYQYLFVFNGTKVYTANQSRKQVIDTNSNRVFKEIARMMLNSVTGKALSNSSDFVIDAFDEKDRWQITLSPKKKEVKSFFSKIELYFSKSNLVIAEINIYEKNRNKTHMVFQNMAVNESLNETLFIVSK